MPPLRAQQGDRPSASFLNYCRDGVAAFQSMSKGLQTPVRHDVDLGYSVECDFSAKADVDIPPYSIFGLRNPTDPANVPEHQPYASVINSDYKTGLYTNLAFPLIAGTKFFPTSVENTLIYRIAVDPTTSIAAGDLCRHKTGDWVAEKGGNQLLALTDPDTEDLCYFLGLPAAGGSEQRLAFVINNDILARSTGEVELIGKDDVKNGTVITIYNPHDVTFYKENVTPGEEHSADRVLVLEVLYWDEPVIFPFMLSECEELDPLYTSEDI